MWWWKKMKWKSENTKKLYCGGRYYINEKFATGIILPHSKNFAVITYNKSTATKKMFEAFGFNVTITGNDISGVSGAPGSSYEILKTTRSFHYSVHLTNTNTQSQPYIYWKW